MKAPHLFTSTTVAIAFLLGSGFSLLPEALAEIKPSAIAKPISTKVSPSVLPKSTNPGTPQPTLMAKARKRYVPPKPPTRGVPGNAGGGGGSRSCMGVAKRSQTQMLNGLNALVPEYKTAKETSVWGVTLSERPTLWFYIPYKSSGIASMELVLQDRDEETLQTIPVAIPETPGIVGVTLLSNKPGLEIGKDYNWFFKVRGKCAEDVGAFVEGWITRTAADSTLTSQLKQLPRDRQAALLAEKGIWYDALTILAELHRSEPDHATGKADWNALLAETGMEPLASIPLVKSAQKSR